MKKMLLLATVIALVLTPAFATPVLVNGGFEAGLAGWTVTDLPGGSGSWFAAGAGPTPFSGNPSVGPAGGVLYAVSDQGGPGTHALTQLFTVSAGSTVMLTFDMFVNDFDGGPIVDPAGLDHTAGPNQHARVDILTAGAGAFDTGAGVLANLYIGVDPGGDPNPYTAYAFDLTGLLGGGGTFQIRFAEVDNMFFLNMGVDNVSLDATAIPEPSTFLLFGAGIAGLTFLRKRR